MPASARTDSRHRSEPLAVYVHWPFCLSKCPYCDFNSHVRESVDHARWTRALTAELEHFARLTGPRAVTSMFFGGGTPSLMEPATVAQVIETVDRLWGLDHDAEITLEANPTSVEADKFRAFADAGVNRASIGVQALDDAALRFLGRGHSADEARAAVALARETFPRISFDLIYARPGQTVDGWTAELEEAIAMAADHLSLYQLTLEPGTGFAGLHARGKLTLPNDEVTAALYEATQVVCESAGLAAYEVSNHARPGAESRHNLTYWRYGDYVGAGPGAHGRLMVAGALRAFAQAKKPEAWLTAVERDGAGTVETSGLSAEDRATEMVMMGLRLSEGLDERSFARRVGAPLDRFIDGDALAVLIALDLVERSAHTLKATARGRPLLNTLVARLLK